MQSVVCGEAGLLLFYRLDALRKSIEGNLMCHGMLLKIPYFAASNYFLLQRMVCHDADADFGDGDDDVVTADTKRRQYSTEDEAIVC